MLLAGCSPAGRNTEQHDVFFGIGHSIRDMVAPVQAFWPEGAGKGQLHLDAWREVTHVNGFAVQVLERPSELQALQLFFINLGGYKRGEFEEFHYKMLVAAGDKGEAVRQAKLTAFFKHTGFKGATSHIDDKYGVDVDDIFAIRDILPAADKQRYALLVQPAPPGLPEDEIHLGYFKLDTVDKWADR